jgi:hypothetical protein
MRKCKSISSGNKSMEGAMGVVAWVLLRKPFLKKSEVYISDDLLTRT